MILFLRFDMIFQIVISFLRSSGKTLSEEEFQQLKEEIAVSRSFGKARKEVHPKKLRFYWVENNETMLG